MTKIEQVIDIVNQAAIYVPEDGEGYRIDAVLVDEGRFVATGEESGDSFSIEFDEVNLDTDLFYKLVQIVVDTAAK